MTFEMLGTSLMLHLEQITDGEATCHYCSRPARMMISNGADPDAEPVCGVHGRSFLVSTLTVVQDLFPV